jgi:signal peptidase I
VNQKLAKAEVKDGATVRPEPSHVRLESKRDLLKFAKERTRETKKLLKRAKRKIDPEAFAQIKTFMEELRAARKAEDVEACRRILTDLDPLIDRHLARFQKSAVREYAEAIGLAVLFALLLRAFVVEAFQIPSESMVPTLLVGDHLFVNKFVYGLRIPFTRFDLIRFGDPEPGDVIVFIYPVEEVRTQVTLRQVMAEINQARHGNAELAYPESLQAAGVTIPNLFSGQGEPARNVLFNTQP